MAKRPTTTSAALPPIAVFHGPDRFQQVEATRALRDQLIKVHGEVSTSLFDGASASPADILDECRSMSLMMQHRFIIVDSVEALLKGSDDEESSAPARRGSKSARELFESYAQAPDSSATLVLRTHAWRGPKLEQAILSSGGIIEKLEEFKPHEAIQWALARAKNQHKVVLQPEAAAKLIESVGADLGRIDSEIAKLSLADPDKPITAMLVQAMTGATREEEFWDFQPSLLSGDSAAALKHLQDLLEISRHDPTPLLFTATDLARKLHGAAQGLRARVPIPALMGKLKLWGSSGNLLLDKAKHVDPRAAAELLEACIEGAYRQRSGRGDPVRILEALTLHFAKVCQA